MLFGKRTSQILKG
jgi:hypothetical protein